MVDAAGELAFWTPLPLSECAPISDAFWAADGEALRNQRWHRRHTVTATLCGGGAVLIGVWILGFETHLGRLGPIRVIELGLAGLVLLSIVSGLVFQRKNRWLLHRHRAERLRLLKFEFLITPSVWLDDPLHGAKWVTARVGEIEAAHDRRALVEAVSTAQLAAEVTPPHLPSSVLLKLVEYYLGKRLNPQKEYLANRAQRNDFWDSTLARNFNTTLFFASVLAVAVQDVINLGWPSTGVLSVIVATLGAASLPVIASMNRTLRSAFEFSRNRSRFHAAHDALSKLEQRLTHHLLWGRAGELPPSDEAVILRELERCESQLRTEHVEWLRLMVDAEWFG